MGLNEGTPLWQSPASSVASVAGSTVRDGATGPARNARRQRSTGLLPTAVTPRMIRTATVAGLVVAMAVYIIGATTMTTTVQPIEAAAAETATLREADTKDASVEDGVLFLPGFGAPLEKQVRPSQRLSLRDGRSAGGVVLAVLKPLWPLALVCVVVLVVLRLIDGPCLDFYVWYVNSMLAWSE
jgi:hypothetical protein